jgi:hypothetical protein
LSGLFLRVVASNDVRPRFDSIIRANRTRSSVLFRNKVHGKMLSSVSYELCSGSQPDTQRNKATCNPSSFKQRSALFWGRRNPSWAVKNGLRRQILWTAISSTRRPAVCGREG